MYVCTYVCMYVLVPHIVLYRFRQNVIVIITNVAYRVSCVGVGALTMMPNIYIEYSKRLLHPHATYKAYIVRKLPTCQK